MMPWPFPDDGWRARADDPDARLARRVADVLHDAGLHTVRADAQYGVVLLGGRVADLRSRDAAADRVRAVPGVRDICNDIAVDGAGPDRFGEIAARLAAERPARSRRAGMTSARVVLVVAAAGVLLADTAGLPLVLIGAGLIALAAALLLRRRGR